MQISVGELARALGARHWGDEDRLIRGAAEPGSAGEGDIALALSPAYAKGLRPGAVAMIADGMDPEALGLGAAIFAPRPRLAMSGLTRAFDPGPSFAPGIHPTAVIDPTAELPADAAVGPFVVIGAGVRIGPGLRIAAHASIGEGARIGANALIFEGARIGHHVIVGDRLILHPNAVIGADGFSFVTEVASGAEAARATLGQRQAPRAGDDAHWHRIHSLGTVELGSDVEIGANSTIDRGTIRSTKVGDGTKIDNLVQIGHNAVLGRDCLVCGQAGVAGSARIGDRVILGGRTAVNDNIFVGDDVVSGGASLLYTNVPAGRIVLGSPAVRIESELEQRKAIRRLPRLFARVAALEGRTTTTTPTDSGDAE